MASNSGAAARGGATPSVVAEFEPDTGLDPRDYRKVAEALGPVLADSYQLFIKTQGVHWNVSGPNFYGLHKLTQDQYEDLYGAIDEIAERIRSLGQIAPASYRAYGEMGRIRDAESAPTPEAQVVTLVRDNGLLCQTLRDALETAEEHDDVVTADLLTQRLSRHEQNGWMLRMIVS
jgi:starvation-inducible DNA-binding protein